VFRRRGGVVGKPRFQLGFDLDEILGLGLEVARVRPLEACLQYASNPPIGIPEVIVDVDAPEIRRDRRRAFLSSASQLVLPTRVAVAHSEGARALVAGKGRHARRRSSSLLEPTIK